jgi:hypothetical protein
VDWLGLVDVGRDAAHLLHLFAFQIGVLGEGHFHWF